MWIGTQWVWHGLSMIRCGMPRVPVHNVDQLVEWWAHCTLEAVSIDMSFAPPLIVAQVYKLGKFYWVFYLPLIVPTREYLYLKFDPLCERPHIVWANKEELVVVDFIAEREGVQPQQWKKWAHFFDRSKWTCTHGTLRPHQCIGWWLRCTPNPNL